MICSSVSLPGLHSRGGDPSRRQLALQRSRLVNHSLLLGGPTASTIAYAADSAYAIDNAAGGVALCGGNGVPRGMELRRDKRKSSLLVLLH